MTAVLTQPQIYDLLLDVGFAVRPARIGAAIALCEAPAGTVGGVPCADFGAIGDQELANDVWGFSYGGFQIRSLRAQKGTGGFRDEERLLSPRFNARAAKEVRRTQGWSAWSTYKSGMYKAYLQDLFPPPPNTYVVVAGDSLTEIAANTGVSWQDLARINSLHAPYAIYIGQHLTLP